METAGSNVERPDTKLALLSRIPASFAMLILVLCLLGPYATVLTLGPAWGLIGIIVVPMYIKIRYPSRAFGPMWLTMLDMIIVVGNSVLVIMTTTLVPILFWGVIILGIVFGSKRTRIVSVGILVLIGGCTIAFERHLRRGIPREQAFAVHVSKTLPDSIVFLASYTPYGFQEHDAWYHFTVLSNDFDRLLAGYPYKRVLPVSDYTNQPMTFVYRPRAFTNWLATTGRSQENLELWHDYYTNRHARVMWTTPDHTEVFFSYASW